MTREMMGCWKRPIRVNGFCTNEVKSVMLEDPMPLWRGADLVMERTKLEKCIDTSLVGLYPSRVRDFLKAVCVDERFCDGLFDA